MMLCKVCTKESCLLVRPGCGGAVVPLIDQGVHLRRDSSAR
jgi:hypothetical protein